MPDYRRLYQNGGTYFFTVVTYGRNPVFRSEAAIALLKGCLEHVALAHPLVIEALVILPDHLHTIWTLPEKECDFSTRWSLIKGKFSHQCQMQPQILSTSRQNKRERAVWQRRFWEHLVHDQNDFNRLCDYIHYNPVKHGLARSPEEWPHSTFREFIARGLYPENWSSIVTKEIKEMSLE